MINQQNVRASHENSVICNAEHISNVSSKTKKWQGPTKEVSIMNAHWYAVRATYGQEKKAYEYILSKGGTAFYPTEIITEMVNGKRKKIIRSRIPNIFFVYGTEKEIRSLVYDNVHLPFLRFYYRHKHDGNQVLKEPVISKFKTTIFR